MNLPRRILSLFSENNQTSISRRRLRRRKSKICHAHAFTIWNTPKHMLEPICNPLYELIIHNIITPSSNPFSHQCDVFTLEPPLYAAARLSTKSNELTTAVNEFNMWQTIYQTTSREAFASRPLLHTLSKSPAPIFSTFSTFCLKYFVKTINDPFMSDAIRAEFIADYCKFKRVHNAFSKLARIWKVRNIPVRIQTDLYMNELDQHHNYTFQLVNPSGIYLFSLSNLTRIIVDAITHQSGMFLEPLPIKNPYTNALLSKADLYNIYLRLLDTPHIRIPEMLSKFFRCEFSIFEFRRRHETELRDIAIRQYANTASIAELAQDVSDMLMAHRITDRINISIGFPSKQLVETMRPFLYLYLLERYSFSSITRKYSASKVDFELKRFAENNPNYGRRVKTTKKKFNGPLCRVWAPESFQVPNPNNITNPFSPPPAELPSRIQLLMPGAFITDVKPQPDYCFSNYMKSHVYSDDVFDRFVELGDNIETYHEQRIYPELTAPDSEWIEREADSPSPQEDNQENQMVVNNTEDQDEDEDDQDQDQDQDDEEDSDTEEDEEENQIVVNNTDDQEDQDDQEDEDTDDSDNDDWNDVDSVS